MQINIPSISEMRQKFSQSKAGWILSFIGLIQTLRGLLDWKASIEEAEMTAHQLSPFLGSALSAVASPLFGVCLMVLGFAYIIFVPSIEHPKSRVVASVAIWLACAASLAVLFFLAVFAVSIRLTGIAPFQVPMSDSNNGYLQRSFINLAMGFSSLAPGKQIGFNVFYQNPTQRRVFNAVHHTGMFMIGPPKNGRPLAGCGKTRLRPKSERIQHNKRCDSL